MNKWLNNTTISIFIGFVFIGTIVLFLISLNKNSSDYTINEPLIPLSEERVTKISEAPEQNIQTNQIRREDYDLNEKPFEKGNYDYDERTADFRLVCTKPCPISKAILDQEFTSISYAVSTLRGLTQSDFEEHILPFEVHASEDSRCPMNPQALAYMTIFTDSNGYNRGILCFFFDKLSYNRDKFPYSTSVHEVTHLLESGKIEHNSIIWEGLSEMMDSFFLKGNDKNSFCWQGNEWYKQIAQNTHDPHW